MRRDFAAVTALALLLAACGKKEDPANPAAEGPPPAKVEKEGDANLVKVDHPEQFPLATAGKHSAAPELNVTGVVNPDVARTVPVISLASGRVVEINARIGDEVKKGQLLFKVRSSDISSAFSDYRKAVVNEQLTKVQLDRSKILYEKGAIAQKDLEVAQNAENNAAVDVETTTERLHVLGSDTNHPTGIVDVAAPVSGVIIEQNIAIAGGVKTLDNSPNLFTIADLSVVWIVCDVFENDMPNIRMGEYADIHLAAYPDRVLKGRISNIGQVLDPSIRTAKVRLEVPNPGPAPGILRVGMFVTATFHGASQEVRATVPSNAVLHLHDRDWVYVPAENGRFRRLSVVGGAMLPGNLQEIISGLKPGDQVVTNALVLQNALEQQ
ncbi:MAG TPA: efflux RND transporter periplasmic adaptor subunit [Bryobacteraceae bacterium]|jgi:cobalt-zinc-cadmium efflux system membrane fusion protein|nr:efflux RND transporter periplasmic adaptor subunit [Bryobacteraceae bacterium]